LAKNQNKPIESDNSLINSRIRKERIYEADDLPGSGRAGDNHLTLEVELSYAAGTLATSATVAWFLYQHTRTIGYATIPELMGALYIQTALQGFVLGLALFLLYRGIEMAARLKSEAPRSEQGRGVLDTEIDQLHRVGSHTFYYSFRWLLRTTLIGTFILGTIMVTSDSRFTTQLIGAIALITGGLLHIPGLFRDTGRWSNSRWNQLLNPLRKLIRWGGVWWVEPPEDIGSEINLRNKYRVFSLFLFLGLFGLNAQASLNPTLTAGEVVYSLSESPLVTIHYRQGARRGRHDSEVSWGINTNLPEPPGFQRLELNHFVAIVPTVGLEPGQYYLQANLRINQSFSNGTNVDPAQETNSDFDVQADAATAHFILVP